MTTPTPTKCDILLPPPSMAITLISRDEGYLCRVISIIILYTSIIHNEIVTQGMNHIATLEFIT